MSELPEGWGEVPISSVVEIIRGVTYQKDQASSAPNPGSLPVLRANNIQQGKLIFEDLVYVPAACMSEKQCLKQGDIIIAMSSGSKSVVGKAARSIADWNGAFGAFCGLLRPLDGVESAFVSWLTHSGDYRSRVSELSSGVNINNLKPSHFDEIIVPIAPLAEQKVIADKLDALLAQVDTLKARLDAIPAILKRFRQSVLSAAVTGKLTEDWRTQNDDLRSWTPNLLGDIAFVTKLAGFEYTEFVKYVPNGDLKVLKAENAGREGFKETEYSTVNSGEVSALTRSRVVAGDLIMAFVGAGTGQVGLVPDGDNWFLGPNIALIRIDTTKASSKFVELFCRSLSGWGEIHRFMKSTAQPSLSMKTIRQFSINLPPIPEQTEIVRRVEALFAFADQIEARAQVATARVKHLTQSILAKAFRGELTEEWRKAHPELVSGQNSAAALLERIRAVRMAVPEAKGKRGRMKNG
jgi:type I restriction enzyme S subunit